MAGSKQLLVVVSKTSTYNRANTLNHVSAPTMKPLADYGPCPFPSTSTLLNRDHWVDRPYTYKNGGEGFKTSTLNIRAR